MPGFAKDPKDFPAIIKARVEGIVAKPSPRAAIKRRRCPFVADGFYEWLRPPAGLKSPSRPFLMRRADGKPLALAGLRETLRETWSDRNAGDAAAALAVASAPDLTAVEIGTLVNKVATTGRRSSARSTRREAQCSRDISASNTARAAWHSPPSGRPGLADGFHA